MQWIRESPQTYWKYFSDLRYQRLLRIAHTKVGALYIKPGETEKQARKRLLNAEAQRLNVSALQLKQLLGLEGKLRLSERKRKPRQEPADSACHPRQ